MSFDNGHYGEFEKYNNQAPQRSVSDNPAHSIPAAVNGTDNRVFSYPTRAPQQQPFVPGETAKEARSIEPDETIPTHSGSHAPRNAFVIPTGGVDTGRSVSYRVPYHIQRDLYLQDLYGGVKDPVYFNGVSAILPMQMSRGVDYGPLPTPGRVVNVISAPTTPASEISSIYAGLHSIQSSRPTPAERQNDTETSSTDTIDVIPMQPLGPQQLHSRNVFLVENGSVVASCQVSTRPRRPIESWGCCGLLSRSPFSLALFTCVCCCIPIGAVAVLFAIMSLFSKANGDTVAHKKFASTSVVTSFVGIVVGVFMTAAYTITTVVLVVR